MSKHDIKKGDRVTWSDYEIFLLNDIQKELIKETYNSLVGAKLNSLVGINRLSRRECEILNRIVNTYEDYQAISLSMGLSITHVSSRTYKINNKLGTNNRAEIIKKIYQAAWYMFRDAATFVPTTADLCAINAIKERYQLSVNNDAIRLALQMISRNER